MAAVLSEKVAGPTPPAPPISQSMDNHDFSKNASADSPSSSPAAYSPDRSPAPTSRTPKELDPQSQLSSRVEEYRQLFRLPSDEVLIQDFNCALQDNFLIQGHMYLFVHHICFYSNLFGFETKKIIPFHEITYVRRAKAIAVFPTSIEIIAGGKKYYFTSFLFRDEAFKLINEGWLQHSNEPKEIADLQEPKFDISSQENGNFIVEESDVPGPSMDESNIIESDKNGFMLEESKPLVDQEPEIVSVSSEVEIREEVNVEDAPVNNGSSSEKKSDCESIDTDAPAVPEGFTKVAEAKFPIRAREFFNLFFSDDGVNFKESFHRKCGDKDFKCTSWVPNEKFGHTRTVSFQHPIKIYFGAKFGICQEAQKYRIYRNRHLIVDTSQDVSDVPYADYFSVEGRWDVEDEGDDSKPGCILRVYTNVVFSKKTMWKGKIVQSTMEECREVYAIWIELAHEVIKKNLEKEPDDQIKQKKSAKALQHTESNPNDDQISQSVPDVRMDQRVNDPPYRNTGMASVTSLLRESVTKFLPSLKNQNAPYVLLAVAVVVVFFLMQISILTLLSRPQQIHVVSQPEYTSENRWESIALLNRQIKHLMDEMQFVETLLERIQHEHARLKVKLMELEALRNQRI